MAQVEPDSWKPAVAVITWLLMSITAVAVVSRLLTKYLLVGGLMADDALIMISFVFGIGNNIAIFVATAHGFGNHTGTIIATMQDIVTKSQLAGALLLILSLLCSKLSMTVFICNLTPASRDHILARVAQGLILVTAVTALLGTAFQCRYPRTWDYLNEQCIDRAAWAVFLATANGITDIVIFAQAMVLILHVQATWKKRFVFASIFLPRLLRVLSESGGDFVLSSTYGRKTKTSTSRASAEWESQSQSSETYIVQEARTWTVDLPTADVAPITASRSGGMGK
ncbi:hypothetical protein AFLA_005375 [Aspergillus flavus NRRL3357]|nr:hypothetical protein AFLA_005375 [Aspergillus flavus NRRL3357]